MTPDFTAVSTCPRCGHIAYHWIDTPPEPPEVLSWTETTSYMIDGTPYATTRLPTYAPGGDMRATRWNTDTCTVVRTCRQCEHLWGEH